MLQGFTLFTNKFLLDQDDLVGPGKLDIPRTTGDMATDYAHFKITKYSESESTLEHKQFARSLAATAHQLGPQAAEYLAPLLYSLVKAT
jgi:hypothetical protein